MKGIILAGGSGTRLNPTTISYSKQLIPIFDKPLVYYPLCTLMNANIRDILVITSDQDDENFKRLLGDGSKWGIKISYLKQYKPNGIAEAFIIGEKFVGDESVALILGDNIFYGIDFEKIFFNNDINNIIGGYIFSYKVPDPSRYGVLEIKNKEVLSIQEKPKKPKSNLAVTGLYFYDNKVVKFAKSLKPSKRKELEITDINNLYIKKSKLKCINLEQGAVWLDAGTSTSLLHASQFVQTIQERQQFLIGSPEDTALKKGFISAVKFRKIAKNFPKNPYGDLLRGLLK